MVAAYNTSLQKQAIQRCWDENDISCTLNSYIKDDKRRKKWKIAHNVEHHLNSGTNTNPNKGYAAKLPRIDFRMVTFSSLDEHEYFFEAKNLKEKDSKLKRRYIETGIDNYISSKYSGGSLLGYILDGRLVQTVKGINKLLKKDLRAQEILVLKQNPIHQYCYESTHSTSLKIEHLMFDFTTMPP